MPALPPATLHTARLRLRPPVAADAPALAQAIGNYDVARWLGRVPYPYGVADAQRFIAGAVPGRTWLIEEGGALVGGISADPDLGYWLARPAWGRGLATEACDAVLDAWFADRRHGVLCAGHFADNARSARVLIKLGFRYGDPAPVPARALGQEVASHRLTLTRAEWQARRRYRIPTPRLSLREFDPADAPAMQRILAQPAVARMLYHIPPALSLEAARRWVEAARFRGRLGFRLAICRRRRVIGAVGLGKVPGKGTVSAVFLLDPAHWGRGFATEALLHLLADALPRFGVETVWADHFDDNPASGAVLRRAGFAPCGSGSAMSRARGHAAPVTHLRLHRADLRHP